MGISTLFGTARLQSIQVATSLLLVLAPTVTACSSRSAPADVAGDSAPVDLPGRPFDIQSPKCPPGMALVPFSAIYPPSSFCVDWYEASLNALGKPVSVPGSIPWTGMTWKEAKAACESQGKRLCWFEELTAACAGPAGLKYPYGNTYNKTSCNTGEAGIGKLVPTGSIATCEGGYPGLFDMSGNAFEWTLNCQIGVEMCKLSGGSYLTVLQTACGAHVSYWIQDGNATNEYIGFRCCTDSAGTD